MARVAFIAATAGDDNAVRRMIAAGYPLKDVFVAFEAALSGCS